MAKTRQSVKEEKGKTPVRETPGVTKNVRRGRRSEAHSSLPTNKPSTSACRDTRPTTSNPKKSVEEWMDIIFRRQGLMMKEQRRAREEARRRHRKMAKKVNWLIGLETIRSGVPYYGDSGESEDEDPGSTDSGSDDDGNDDESDSGEEVVVWQDR